MLHQFSSSESIACLFFCSFNKSFVFVTYSFVSFALDHPEKKAFRRSSADNSTASPHLSKQNKSLAKSTTALASLSSSGGLSKLRGNVTSHLSSPTGRGTCVCVLGALVVCVISVCSRHIVEVPLRMQNYTESFQLLVVYIILLL